MRKFGSEDSMFLNENIADGDETLKDEEVGLGSVSPKSASDGDSDDIDDGAEIDPGTGIEKEDLSGFEIEGEEEAQ